MKKPDFFISTALTCLFLAAGNPFSFGQQTQENYQLLMKSGDYQIEANLERFIKAPDINQSEVVEGKYFRLMQFYAIPTQDKKEELQAAGIKFLNYIPNKAYFVSIPAQFDVSKFQDYNIRSIAPIIPEYKLTPVLVNKDYPEWALLDQDHIELIVNFFEGLNKESVIATIEANGFEISDKDAYINSIKIVTHVDRINTLASMPMISYIEPIEPPSFPENLVGRTDHRSHAIAVEYTTGRHYDGTDMNVMMQDDGIIGPHIDYTGRLDQSAVTSNNGNHGDHVAGTIMGAGNLDPLTRGMAFGAKLFVYGSNNNNYNSVPTLYTNDEVRITSKSYSNGCNAGYTTLTQQLDQQVRQMPELIHVFSAGNAGTSDCGYGAGAGWGNVTGGHKMGKNVVTVANLTYVDNLATSSSRGPAHDGRIKPDVSAVGTNVYSTQDVNTYDYKTGTSMSCPGVAGTITQLYDCYKDNNGNVIPEAALIKCALLNGCDDIGNLGPDFKHGWGRINGLRSAKTIEDVRYLNASISQAGNNIHNIIVPASLAQVRFMIYWTDWEAAVNANPALVNDLNMVVTDPVATNFNPWVLDETPIPANLDLPAVQGIDNLNNMEQVTIDNPVAGSYTISINGFNVPQGPQVYYITYEFITDEVEIVYPIGAEGFNPGETETIRWDAYGNTGTFDLEYSTDNGGSWSTIQNNVTASQRYYDWTVPNVLTGEALVRVIRGASTGISDEAFSIIGVPSGLVINWACPDSCELAWNAVAGATGYEISMLGTKYMDSIGTSLSTSLVITGINPVSSFWFSVKALGTTNAIGRRALAIEKIPGVWNCIIAVDAAVPQMFNPVAGTLQDCHDNSAIDISIEIENNGQSDISNVPVFYSINAGIPISETYIGTITPGNSDTYTFTATADLSVAGNYTIASWVTYPLDGNTFNDTSTAVVEVIAVTPLSLPISENFETFPLCSEAMDCEAIVCTTPNDWTNETNLQTDDIDWRTDEDGTPSNNTGPATDYDPGTTSGNYLYLEASNGCDFKEAYLISLCIDLSTANQPELTFAYHMWGSNMGTLHVDLFGGGIWTNDITTVISGNQGNSWQTRTVDLTPYIGQNVNLRFRGITGNGYMGDMAIDAISLVDLCPPPVANFSYSFIGLTANFTDNSTNGPIIAWEWNFGDGSPLDNNQNPSHTYSVAGSYTVTLVTTNSCGTDTAIQIINSVSIDEFSLPDNVQVYPNPSNGVFNVRISNPNSDAANISVSDIRGRTIIHRNIPVVKHEFIEQVDLSKFATGIYYLHITLGNIEYHTKLAVQ